MPIEVIDANGVMRDESWLASHYGLRIEKATGNHFALVRVVCTASPAVVSVAVVRPDGLSDVGRGVALAWPGIVAEPGTENINIDPAYKTRPATVACVQTVTATGFVRGFGLSASWYGVPPNGGPGTLWVLSPSIPSDVVRGLGMLPNTVHEGPLVLTFREVDEYDDGDGGTGDGGTGDGGGEDDEYQELLDLLAETNRILLVIGKHLGAAL